MIGVINYLHLDISYKKRLKIYHRHLIIIVRLSKVYSSSSLCYLIDLFIFTAVAQNNKFRQCGADELVSEGV